MQVSVKIKRNHQVSWEDRLRGGGELLWFRKGKGLVERNTIKAPWGQSRVMERSVPFNNALFSCPNETLGHVHRQSSVGGKWLDRGAVNSLAGMLLCTGWGLSFQSFSPGLYRSKAEDSKTAPDRRSSRALEGHRLGLRLLFTPSKHVPVPEPIMKVSSSEQEGSCNNERVINADRQAALTITFQLLVVGGQIIPFHHISHYTAHLLSTFSHETL